MTTGTGESREREDAADTEVTYDIPADTFAARLVLVRHHCGRLSIEQAATGAGINAEAWRRWEDGAKPRDRIEVSQAISETYRMNLDWLMFGGPLLGSRGKPAVRPPGTTRGYERSLFGQAATSTRPTSSRPKVRTDRHRPIQPAAPGRRAVRVNPVSAADSPYAA